MYLISFNRNKSRCTRLNPYSNGTMYLMQLTNDELFGNAMRLNPYSNGTMYLIQWKKLSTKSTVLCLNPYSNGTMYLIPFFYQENL